MFAVVAAKADRLDDAKDSSTQPCILYSGNSFTAFTYAE